MRARLTLADALGRPSMTSIARAMAVPAHRADTATTAITFGCWRFPAPSLVCPKRQHARKWSWRRENMHAPKRLSLDVTRGDEGVSAGTTAEDAAGGSGAAMETDKRTL